jgi:hypothetical protein
MVNAKEAKMLPVFSARELPKRSLSIFPQNQKDFKVQIATPCDASWSNMQGNQRKRFCGSCQKNVYNLVGLRTEEIKTFMHQHEGQACVRLLMRQDGSVLGSDCRGGLAQKAAHGSKLTLFTLGLFLASLLVVLLQGESHVKRWKSAIESKQHSLKATPTKVMGEVMGRTIMGKVNQAHIMGGPAMELPELE